AINLEVGRYTLATGESAYGAFARLGRVWVPAFIALNVAGWLLPGWARICAGAFKAVAVGADGPGEPWQWTALTFALVALVLFGPRHVYRTIERTTITLVACMMAGLITIAWKLATPEALAQLAAGVASVGYKPADMPAYELFSAVVFAGAGGTANLVFSYYLIDKGWGMGARTGEGCVGSVAFTPIESERNLALWRRWFAHVQRDQWLFFWLMNTVTILLFILSALVVLHGEGIVPQREMLLLEEAAILERVWGRAGSALFMAVGIACLFSTQLTLLDCVARSLSDLLRTNYRWAARYGWDAVYRSVAIGWMITGVGLTWAWGSLPPIMFLLSAGFFGGIAMAVYCPLLLIANHRLLPPAYRPGRVRTFVFAGISLFYIAFAVSSLWVVGMRLVA
ncbi:MAG: Nramp family divalent metal transporter, partial [Candidatus Binatia bacterium]